MTSLHRQEAPPPASRVEASAARYIKLGPSGAWVERCLREGVIELDHNEVSHALAEAGDWEGVRQVLKGLGRGAGKVTDFTRELRDFYTLPDTALWVTVARGRLWWAFAEPQVEPVTEAGRGARLRRTKGAWRSTDVNGQPLLLDRLSTRLTKVAAYRQTLCSVEAEDYLLRRINAEPEPVVTRALEAQAALVTVAELLIQGLHWKEFELLADLILAGSGWRRVSAVGGSEQADSDLILEQAATGERAMVQVKSSASQAVLEDYAERFRTGGWDRWFLLCHSSAGRLTAPTGADRFHLWQGRTLAEQAVRGGLVDWLIEKNR